MEAKLKSQDLRKGNLMAICGIVCTVCEILESKVGIRLYTEAPQEIDYHEYYNLKSIPLTEEWLGKFGLQSENNTYPIPDRFNIFITVNNKFLLCDGNTALKRVRFVHELQNVIFYLTYKELTLTETPCPEKE